MVLPESEAFNIEFVQTVEKHRCLYDVNLQEYSSKDEQDKAWSRIAHKFSATEAECKRRWKYLRGGLTRYNKKLRGASSQEAKKIKQFYLWNFMQFVLPFLKSRDRSRTLVSLPLKNEDQEPGANEIEVELYCEDDNTDDTSRETYEIPYQPETKQTPPKRARTEETLTAYDSLERAAFHFQHNAAQVPQNRENPDLEFFKSILPDMAELNASQKRRFKVRVLQLLDELATERATLPPSVSLHSSSATEYASGTVSYHDARRSQSGQTVDSQPI
ncbi:transcription factor adf-1 [Plakobranchus ocellatus]|uniref:Transcription factor adf-1 n=1 Tax=Plakobranchus ocellatus TaxID=259542 RepID=A0AAV4A939_9GAST|nr:transcription factor adf-1 [Plakobranchus ocellatus]